eukprot:CAMPEP_0178486032 /NCGR_PEP_ID=MMETSP0696-20121128/8590_1 /TAXON_ID=265572 /ORGANISM="Extubocellulus spinifer, Strain CCMP396" /LENGTH=771 /DNA_ID=CAMNT_0020113667 /DNA_START=247 /DNA_END=2562 /DNA_ORIENTATION=+
MNLLLQTSALLSTWCALGEAFHAAAGRDASFTAGRNHHRLLPSSSGTTCRRASTTTTSPTPRSKSSQQRLRMYDSGGIYYQEPKFEEMYKTRSTGGSTGISPTKPLEYASVGGGGSGGPETATGSGGGGNNGNNGKFSRNDSAGSGSGGEIVPDDRPTLPATNDPYILLGLVNPDEHADDADNDGENSGSTPQHSPSTIEIDPSELKRVYKRLIKQYHPDAVLETDSTDEQRKWANQNFARITAAYHAILNGVPYGKNGSELDFVSGVVDIYRRNEKLMRDAVARQRSAGTSARGRGGQRRHRTPPGPHLKHDSDLTHVADAIAERILHHQEEFGSNDIQTILNKSGFTVTSFGFAWGATTYDDYDDVEDLVVDAHPDIVGEESYTHYALGFARAEPGSDVNAYIVLAVAYNECDEVCEIEEQTEQGYAMLELVNGARLSAGLNPLTLDTDALYRAALWHSNDMVTHGYPTQRRGGRAHVGTDGSTATDRVEREGYQALSVRENILSRWDANAEGAFEQWWTSPGHRRNMMADDITSMALSVTCDAESGQYYYTQILARPFNEVEPTDMIRPLVARLHEARAQFNQRPLFPNRVLMDYADLLAEYIAEHDEMPQHAWEMISPHYSYEDITALVSWLPNDDADRTVEYMAETYANELQHTAFSEMGVGIYRDSTKKLYYNVVILARPRENVPTPPPRIRRPRVIHPRGRDRMRPREVVQHGMDSARSRPPPPPPRRPAARRDERGSGRDGEQDLKAFANSMGEKLSEDRCVY